MEFSSRMDPIVGRQDLQKKNLLRIYFPTCRALHHSSTKGYFFFPMKTHIFYIITKSKNTTPVIKPLIFNFVYFLLRGATNIFSSITSSLFSSYDGSEALAICGVLKSGK